MSPDDEAEAEPQDSADDEEDGDDFPDSLWSGIEEDEEFANLSPEIKARMREILRASEPGQNGTEFPENGIE